MATFAIGDIQGCYDYFMQLLEKLKFDPSQDRLWLTGDVVNRGPDSLKTLRVIKSIEKNITCVLGNHDLSMLAVLREKIPFDSKHHTFQAVMEAEDRESLAAMLESMPLIHHDTKLGYTLVHAGLHPTWDLALALELSKEVEIVLQSPDKGIFYAHMYGNQPQNWDSRLTGFDRLRFIANCFTRLRFCSLTGELEFNVKAGSLNAAPGYMPWFKIPDRKNRDLKIIFGHWAALQGNTFDEPNVFALDTGCVWGGALTALRLEDGMKVSVSCR